eukprot:3227585-Rhodomonas_salina.1
MGRRGSGWRRRRGDVECVTAREGGEEGEGGEGGEGRAREGRNLHDFLLVYMVKGCPAIEV